jgi:hypothetical protein
MTPGVKICKILDEPYKDQWTGSIDSSVTLAETRVLSSVPYRSQPMHSKTQFPIRFTYPFWQYIITGIMGAFFLGTAMISACAPGMKIWISFVLLGLAWLSLYTWYALSPQIYLDVDGIIQKRFGREIKIHFYDITRITNQAFNERLVIWGVNGKIVVEKQLNHYQEFYRLFTELLPVQVLDNEYQAIFPLEVCTQRWIRGIYLGLIVIGLAVFFSTIRSSSWLDGALIAGFLIVGGLALYLSQPDKYVFDHDQIVVVYPGRREVYSRDNLMGINIESPLDMDTLSRRASLKLSFTKGKVIIPGNLVDYPIERLVSVLSQYYQEKMLRSSADE